MNTQQLSQEELLTLMNKSLYAFCNAETKDQEKQQYKNIKALEKTLKKQFNKKVVFNESTLQFDFKN